MSNLLDLSKIKYIISDWDGTLVDSMPEYTKAFSSVLKSEFNISSDKSEHFFIVEAGGKALSFQFKEAIKRLAKVNIKQSEKYEMMFWDILKSQAPNFISGAREFLQELKKHSFYTTVWSGTRTEILEFIAKRLDIFDYIDFFIGIKTGSMAKVKGSGLFEDIAKHFNKTTDDLACQTIVIGDMVGDIEAGKEIGAVTVGLGNLNDLKFKDADFVVQTHKELLDMLTF